MKLWIAFFLPSFCLALGNKPHPQDNESTVPKAVAKILTQDQKTLQGQIVFPKFLVSGKYHWLSLIDGQLYTFGQNYYGQLATGHSLESEAQVHLLDTSSKIIQVAAGDYHSMVLTQSGQIWSFGANYFGQLGNDSLDSRFSPRKVLITEVVSSIHASGDLSLALTESGQVYAWGLFLQNRSQKEDRQFHKAPQRIPFSYQIKQVLALPEYIVAISKDGDLLIYNLIAKKEIIVLEGKNLFAMSYGEHPMVSSSHGQNWILHDEFFEDLEMGNLKMSKYRLEPDIHAKQIAGSKEHYLILTKDGELWQLRFKNSLKSMIKVPINKVMDIGLGQTRAFAIDIRGRVWAWAVNESAPHPQYQLPLYPKPQALPGRLNYFYRPFERSRL